MRFDKTKIALFFGEEWCGPYQLEEFHNGNLCKITDKMVQREVNMDGFY